MRTARINFVERIAKFTGIIPESATLLTNEDPHRYDVFDSKTRKIDYTKSVYIWVDKLKSGKYSIKIKQRGKRWEDDKVKELQEAFNPTSVQIKQRFYSSCGWRTNVINFYCNHLLW